MLKFFINAQELASQFGEFKASVQVELEKGVQALSAMTHAKVSELASNSLSTSREKYLKALDYQEVAPGVWVVSLDESMLWLEDGRKAGDMTEDLLKKNAKTAKDGSRYKSIPFDQAKPTSQQNQFSRDMTKLIKDTLRRENRPYKKLELNADGSPRIGKIGSFDIDSPLPSSRANTPALFGLSIYQTKTASGRVRKDIVTFRTVSSKMKGQKWIHPGIEAKKFMDKSLEWAEKEWETSILPAILEKFK